MKKLVQQFLPIFLFVAVFSSCVDEDFDRPPTDGSDPGLTVTTTIAELKAMHAMGSFETISDDLVIKGVVVADDASGNWYRTFVLQDETGGIEVLNNLNESYFLYPRGREIYIKLRGLILGDYNNLVQLGGYVASDNSLGPIVETTDHLIKSVKRGEPVPAEKTIAELSNEDVSTLIVLKDVQFAAGELGKTYADYQNLSSVNLTLEDCDKNSITIRTSGYADFAKEMVATGKGTLTGIFSVYGTTKQIFIRDLNDVQLNEDRCSCSSLVVSSINEDFESGNDNDPIALAGWNNFSVSGSNVWEFQFFDNNTFAEATAFQDSGNETETWLVTPRINVESGQVFSFESAKAFYTHDGLSVWVTTDFDCDPTQVVWQPLSAKLAGSNDANYEWIPSGDINLSALAGQQIVIGFKYKGSSASGLTTNYRIDNVKLTSSEPCGGNTVEVAYVNEDFQSGVNNANVELTGWTNVAIKGTRLWIYKEFDTNVYVQSTAYNDASPEMESWLITPIINLDVDKVLSFESAKAFWTHDGMSVWISTDFECDVIQATWQPLACTLAGQSDADHDWIPSGTIDLSGLTGNKVAIGFKYVGNNTAGLTTSYRIDNLVVEDK